MQVVSNTSDCENHITIKYDIVAVDMMDGAVFSCVSSHKENNSKLFIETSAPIVIMDASKHIFSFTSIRRQCLHIEY